MGGGHGFVEFLQPLKLRGEAALGGRVDDEHDFVLEVGERVGFAFLCLWPSEDVGLADERGMAWGYNAS